MGIFRKFFSKKKTDAAPATAVAPAPAKATPPQAPARTYKARAPRVGLFPLRNVVFKQTEPKNPLPIPVFNISTTGVGLMRQPYPVPPERGQLLRGSFRLGDQTHRACVRVAHVTGSVIGGQFDENAEEIAAAVRGLFQLEIAAAAMMKIDPKHHRREPDGDSHWIRGDNSDLYYVESGGRILRFRLTFFGNHFEGSENAPPQAGQLVEEGASPGYKGSELVSLETKPSAELFQMAGQYLRNIPHLPPEHLTAISKMLRL